MHLSYESLCRRDRLSTSCPNASGTAFGLTSDFATGTAMSFGVPPFSSGSRRSAMNSRFFSSEKCAKPRWVSLRVERGEIERDPPAHGETDDVRFRRAEEVEHAGEVARIVDEVERAVVVVALAVAARVPCHGMPMLREGRQVGVPVALVAADPMQEDDEVARSHVVDRDMRRRSDARRGPAGHAAPPWFLE